MTDSGRTVYGGGGIAPDEKYVPEKLKGTPVPVESTPIYLRADSWAKRKQVPCVS